jgi:hypothetical protein
MLLRPSYSTRNGNRCLRPHHGYSIKSRGKTTGVYIKKNEYGRIELHYYRERDDSNYTRYILVAKVLRRSKNINQDNNELQKPRVL